MAAGWAELAREVDDLEMELVPRVAGKEALEVVLGFYNVFAAAKAPAFGAAVDVGIDGKSGMVKGLRHDDGSCFMANARKLF